MPHGSETSRRLMVHCIVNNCDNGFGRNERLMKGTFAKWTPLAKVFWVAYKMLRALPN